MDINPIDVLGDPRQCAAQVNAKISGMHDADIGLPEQRTFERVDVADTDQADGVLGHRPERRHRRGELGPAPARDRRDRGSIQKPARCRLRRIEIGVRIEPRDSRPITKAGEGTHRGVAVSGQHDRKSIGVDRVAHRARQHSHQLERCPDLRVPGARWQLGDLGVHGVRVESERVLEAGSEEALGAGAHADAAVAGVVRDGEELDFHALKLLA
jgi:hypothetical protein